MDTSNENELVLLNEPPWANESSNEPSHRRKMEENGVIEHTLSQEYCSQSLLFFVCQALSDTSHCIIYKAR